jgi:hypothetical protein
MLAIPVKKVSYVVASTSVRREYTNVILIQHDNTTIMKIMENESSNRIIDAVSWRDISTIHIIPDLTPLEKLNPKGKQDAEITV